MQRFNISNVAHSNFRLRSIGHCIFETNSRRIDSILRITSSKKTHLLVERSNQLHTGRLDLVRTKRPLICYRFVKLISPSSHDYQIRLDRDNDFTTT